MEILKLMQETTVPMIVAICLVVGYVVKKWVKDVDNKYIPTLVLVLGLALGLASKGFSIEAAAAGMISGLASTGLHQMYKNFLEGKKEKENA
jgi:hypothetical protein|nr:MAG TPA: holin [Caudoviricetes sp.]